MDERIVEELQIEKALMEVFEGNEEQWKFDLPFDLVLPVLLPLPQQ